jgi:hypothetical protein
MDRWDVFDLMTPKSKETFDTMVAQNDPVISDEQLKKFGITLPQLVATPTTFMNAVPKAVKLKKLHSANSSLLVKDPATINKEEALKHNFRLMNLYVHIHAAILKNKIDKAIKAFLKNKELAKMHQAYLILQARRRAAKDQDEIRMIEIEQEQLATKMLEQMNKDQQAKLEQIHELHGQILEIGENIRKIRKVREEMLVNDAQEIGNLLANHTLPNGRKIFEGKSPEQITAIQQDFILIPYEINRKILQHEHSQNKLQNANNDLHRVRNQVALRIANDLGINGDTKKNYTKEFNSVTFARQFQVQSEDPRIKGHPDIKAIDAEIANNIQKITVSKEAVTSLQQDKDPVRIMNVIAEKHNIEPLKQSDDNAKREVFALVSEKVEVAVERREGCDVQMQHMLNNAQSLEDRVRNFHAIENTIPEVQINSANVAVTDNKAQLNDSFDDFFSLCNELADENKDISLDLPKESMSLSPKEPEPTAPPMRPR